MGTSASGPLNIEAFRPPGDSSTPQPDGRPPSGAEDATAVALSLCVPARTRELSATTAAASAAPAEVSVASGDNPHDKGAEAAGGDDFSSLPNGEAPAPADPISMAGKRSCAAVFSVGDGSNSSNNYGSMGLEEVEEEENSSRKRAARQRQANGTVGVVALNAIDASVVVSANANANSGDSSQAATSAEIRPGAAGTTAHGMYAAAAAAALDAAVDPVLSTTAVVDHRSSASPAATPTSFVTTTATAPPRVETPQFRPQSRRNVNIGPPTALLPQPSIIQAVGSAHPPSLFGGSVGHHSPAQQVVVGTPQLVVGTESGAFGCDAPPSATCSPPPPPPPPGPPVLEPTMESPRSAAEGGVTSGMYGAVNEYLLQIPSLAHQMHAVSPQPTAAFGSAAVGAEESLVSVAAAVAGIPSIAAILQFQHHQRHQQQHHPLPLLPLPPAEPTDIDVGTESCATSNQQMPMDFLSGGGGVQGTILAAVPPHQGAGANYGGRVQCPQNQQENGPATSSASSSGGSGGGGGSGSGHASSGNNPSKRRRARRPCGADGCKRRPIFGAEGTRRAEFCSAHKQDGFVNVLCKQCDAEGCKHQPSFGIPGGKPVRCATHRSEGMVNLSAPRCVSPACRVVPSFAKQGAKRASACAAHRRDGDVDVVSRRCHHEGCVHRPVFGYLMEGRKHAERKAHYCSAHKLDGMLNVFVARCAEDNCTELATFGPQGIKKPTHCAKHQTQEQERRR
ncbi:unnamed protein product [Pylaiella littoralis]